MGEDLGKTTTGIQANVEALLCYLLGWITGLIFFLVEKENKFVRFHAIQSLILFGALHILTIVLVFTVFLPMLISIIAFVLWITLMITSYQGKKIKIPVAGDVAEKYA